MIYLVIFNAYLDACLASFALAAAERTMEEKKWWGAERSRCPNCGHTLSAAELLPIISYLWLKGHCRHCGAKIDISCIAVELLGLFFGAVSALTFAGNFFALVLCHTAALFLIFSTVTDIKSGFVYDNWAYAMAIAALGIRLAFGGFVSFADGLYGAAAGFSLFFGIYLCSRKKGMGLGDACIMLGIGSLLGLKLTLAGLYAAFFAGALVAVPLLLAKKATRKTALPLVPFLAAGTAFALFFGNILLEHFAVAAAYPFL